MYAFPSTAPYWFATAVALVVGGYIVASRLRVRRAERKFLEDRPTLDLNAVYTEFYAHSGLAEDSVIEVWREVADALNIAPGKLRPTDRFGADVGRYFELSDKLDELHVAGLRRAKRLGVNPDFEQVKTVDDYVRALSKRKSEAAIS